METFTAIALLFDTNQLRLFVLYHDLICCLLFRQDCNLLLQIQSKLSPKFQSSVGAAVTICK